MRFFFEIQVLMLLILGTIPVARAQKTKGLDVGISILSGKNFYNKKFYGQSELPPGTITRVNSNYLWGVSLVGENYISSHVSSVFDVIYSQIDVPTNTLCECNYNGSVYLQYEKHHWGSLSAGLRYYFNPRSKVAFFTDGKVLADWLIGAKVKRDNNIKMHWDAFGYKRFAPSFGFSLGAKWNRISLTLDYHANLARTITRNAGVYDQIVHPIKTGFYSQGIFTKATITGFKIR